MLVGKHAPPKPDFPPGLFPCDFAAAILVAAGVTVVWTTVKGTKRLIRAIEVSSPPAPAHR
jgi:hypothetical protein